MRNHFSVNRFGLLKWTIAVLVILLPRIGVGALSEIKARAVHCYPNQTCVLEFAMPLSSSKGQAFFAEMNERVLRLFDSDGVATLGLIHLILTQGPIGEMRDRQLDWETLSTREVPHWTELHRLLMMSMGKADAAYAPHGDFARQRAEMVALKARLEPLTSITYGVWAETVSRWLLANARNHTYPISRDDQKVEQFPLLDNSTNNPIGTLFASYGSFGLGPEIRGLRMPDYLTFDVGTLIHWHTEVSEATCGAQFVDRVKKGTSAGG